MNRFISRTRILISVVIVMLFPQVLDSKSAATHGGKQKKPGVRAPRVRAVRPKQADPELQWKDCGDSCIGEIFNGAVSPVRIPPVKGAVRGAAVDGENVYLLVQDFNLITDAIIVLKRNTGRIQTIWGIGRHRAAAISFDGRHLWVLSRSEKYFLRRLTPDGKGAGEMRLSPLPEGDLNGLSCAGDNFVFTVRGDGMSDLYRYDTKTRSARKIFFARGALPAIIYHQEHVFVYINEFDAYSRHWLLMLGPAGEVKKRIRFINAVPLSFSSDGKNIYMMEKKDPGLIIYPFALRNDNVIVLADPRVRRVDVTFPVVSRNPNPFTADLWIPYPINRRFQNVRRITIDPKPREIVKDKFGNRWARIRWDRAGGSVSALLHVDIITAATAYTLDRNYISGGGDIPAEILSASLQETCAFDISNYIIKSHATRILLDGPGVSRIMEIQKYVHGAIRFFEQESRWGSASEYLYKGRGDEFGHAVSFAAVSRFLGIPARVAGGLILDGGGRPDGDMTSVWGQAYLPGTGWIDIGCGQGRSGGDPGCAAFRPNTCYVTFEGDFDKVNYASVFTETGWYGTCRWTSVDARRKADVVMGRVRVSARDLSE